MCRRTRTKRSGSVFWYETLKLEEVCRARTAAISALFHLRSSPSSAAVVVVVPTVRLLLLFAREGVLVSADQRKDVTRHRGVNPSRRRRWWETIHQLDPTKAAHDATLFSIIELAAGVTKLRRLVQTDGPPSSSKAVLSRWECLANQQIFFLLQVGCTE